MYKLAKKTAKIKERKTIRYEQCKFTTSQRRKGRDCTSISWPIQGSIRQRIQTESLAQLTRTTTGCRQKVRDVTLDNLN